MKRLTKNPWRLGWILLTNGLVILLFFVGPIRLHHDQQLLYQAMRENPPSFSYVGEVFSAPWALVLLAALVVGIFAEVRRKLFSPILNLGPYMIWLLVAVVERLNPAAGMTAFELSFSKVFLIIPLSAVIAIDLAFYIIALKHKAIHSD